jgi:hypothetical protein
MTAMRVEDIQHRDEHGVIADLVGKGAHLRTIPVPDFGCKQRFRNAVNDRIRLELDEQGSP